MEFSNVCIVGGGSAGWMSATTFVRKLDADVTLIESPDVPVSGVGESTLGAIQEWLEEKIYHRDSNEEIEE